MLCGYVIGGWLMAKAAVVAAANLEGPDRQFYRAKTHTARFYAEQVLPNALALARVVRQGGESVVETDAALI
jgi:butyryl-CoA dehydrogenase